MVCTQIAKNCALWLSLNSRVAKKLMHGHISHTDAAEMASIMLVWLASRGLTRRNATFIASLPTNTSSSRIAITVMIGHSWNTARNTQFCMEPVFSTMLYATMPYTMTEAIIMV